MSGNFGQGQRASSISPGAPYGTVSPEPSSTQVPRDSSILSAVRLHSKAQNEASTSSITNNMASLGSGGNSSAKKQPPFRTKLASVKSDASNTDLNPSCGASSDMELVTRYSSAPSGTNQQTMSTNITMPPNSVAMTSNKNGQDTKTASDVLRETPRSKGTKKTDTKTSSKPVFLAPTSKGTKKTSSKTVQYAEFVSEPEPEASVGTKQASPQVWKVLEQIQKQQEQLPAEAEQQVEQQPALEEEEHTVVICVSPRAKKL